MKQHKIFNIKKTLMAVRHSIRGLKIAFLTESALRLEIGIFIILIPFSFVFKSNFLNQVLLITPWFLVIIVELINTAVETIVDRIGLEHHQLSAKAKDIGSAAVFIAILNAVVIWLLLIVNMLK
jgi:diacylglycerol kinase (ATP)